MLLITDRIPKVHLTGVKSTVGNTDQHQWAIPGVRMARGWCRLTHLQIITKIMNLIILIRTVEMACIVEIKD